MISNVLHSQSELLGHGSCTLRGDWLHMKCTSLHQEGLSIKALWCVNRMRVDLLIACNLKPQG